MLNRIKEAVHHYLKHTDLLLMGLALLICLFGLVLIWSGCQPVKKVTPERVMMVQTIGIALGFAGMIILSLIDLTRVPWLWIVVFVFNILLQLSLQFIGKEVGGNKSWIPLPGGMNIQPGEVGKILFIFTMASHINLLRGKLNHVWSVIQLVLHMVITAGAVIAISHDLGVALMYPLIFAVMLFVSGISKWWIGGMFCGAVGVLPILWKFMGEEHRLRILVVFDPSLSEKRAWHAKQTQTAVSNGQLLGNGYMNGTRTQSGWIPESHTDSIFSVAAEELGFIGAALLLGLLMLLILRIYYDSWRATDLFHALLCAGVGGMFMWQVTINIAMNLGVFPVIGLPLPLVSYGGSSVLTTLTSLGLVCGAVGRIKPNWLRTNED